MKDYNVTVKVRNNYLLTAMRQKGCQTAADLHRLSGVPQVIIGQMLNLKILPMTKKGEWRKAVKQIAKTLGLRNPTELFPAQHLNVTLETNTAESEMSIEEISTLLIGDGAVPEHLMLPDDHVEQEDVSQALLDAVNSLPGREPEILKMRFGLENYKEHNLQWIGDYFGLSKERIRTIEAKALRHMRHPTHNKPIKAAGYEPGHGYESLNNKKTLRRAEEKEKREREEIKRWNEKREQYRKTQGLSKKELLAQEQINRQEQIPNGY